MPGIELHSTVGAPCERQSSGLWPRLAEATVVAGLATYAVVLLIPVIAQLGSHLGQ